MKATTRGDMVSKSELQEPSLFLITERESILKCQSRDIKFGHWSSTLNDSH